MGATADSSEDISLAWTDNSSNESAFEVERSPVGANSWAKVANVGSGGVVYVDGGLNPDTTYDYRVRAINCAGLSDYTNVASATTDPMAELPAVPDGLIAVFDGVVTVDVSWNAATGAETYDVGRAKKEGKGNNWSSIATVANNVTGTVHPDATVDSETTYRYYVRSRACAGVCPRINDSHRQIIFTVCAVSLKHLILSM